MKILLLYSFLFSYSVPCLLISCRFPSMFPPHSFIHSFILISPADSFISQLQVSFLFSLDHFRFADSDSSTSNPAIHPQSLFCRSINSLANAVRFVRSMTLPLSLSLSQCIQNPTAFSTTHWAKDRFVFRFHSNRI